MSAQSRRPTEPPADSAATPATPPAPTADQSASRATQRRARLVTYGLVLAMFATVATGTENWPLSQFQLFSGVRTDESRSWQLAAVDAQGTESRVDLSGLPARLGLVSHLLPGLRTAAPGRQQETVRLWLDAVGADDPGTVAVRVYLVRSTVPTVAGGRPEVLDRTLSYEVPLR